MSKTTNTITMDELLDASTVNQLKAGDMVDGKVLSIKKHEVWIDLGPFGIGVIMQKDLQGAGELEINQELSINVVDPEMDEGYALLSMKRVEKDRGWDELRKVYDNSEIVQVTSYDANRGGLLVELEGVRGFLPVYS